MRQGGIFNGDSAIGAVTPDELDEFSEAPGTSIDVPANVTDYDTPETIAAIIASDQAKLDALKPATPAAPASSGGWAGLTDLQKLGIGVAGVLVVGAIWKGMKPSRSYASNPAKRRKVSRARSVAAKRAWVRRTQQYVAKIQPSTGHWGVYDSVRDEWRSVYAGATAEDKTAAVKGAAWMNANLK